MTYYISKTISNRTFEQVRAQAESALKTEGFGVLTVIDIQATMKAKLDKDYLPHVILGACNPVYADKVLSIEPRISTLLPCNLTLRELENGAIEVAAIDPAAAMTVVANDQVQAHALEVREKLCNVLNNI
ncbi:MAG: DUF302 domain-containing protein [Bacteroidetes bacterium]|nr:DUF302 domain-containing protein [Bacteroidota bacterium]